MKLAFQLRLATLPLVTELAPKLACRATPFTSRQFSSSIIKSQTYCGFLRLRASPANSPTATSSTTTKLFRSLPREFRRHILFSRVIDHYTKLPKDYKD